MAMERWNPFREMLALRDMMDRVFEDSFARGTLPAAAGSRINSFPMDLVETDQGYVLRASLPGVKPEDVQVTIHGDTLTIRGQTSGQEERKEQNYIIREQRSGSFQRMVSLPAPINPDQAEARFENGVLQLTLPRAEAAQPRQIKVGGGASGQIGAGPGSQGQAPTAGGGSSSSGQTTGQPTAQKMEGSSSASGQSASGPTSGGPAGGGSG